MVNVDEKTSLGSGHLVSDAIRRWWWLIALPGLVLALGGYLFAGNSTSTYQSTTRVLLKPLPGLPFAADNAASANQLTIAMTTEAQLVFADAVVAAANQRLTDKISTVEGDVSTSVPPNTQLVQIGVRGATAAAAQNGATEVAKAYLAYRSKLASDIQATRVAALDKRVAAAKTQLAAASKAAAAAVPVPEAAQQVQLYAADLVSAQNALNEAKSLPLSPGEVLVPASLPVSASGPSPKLTAAAGLLAGLLLGLLLAIWRERADDRLRPSAASLAGLPVLNAVMPGAGTATVDACAAARVATLATVPAPGIVTVGSLDDPALGRSVAGELEAALRAAGLRSVVVDRSADGAVDEHVGSREFAESLARARIENDYVVIAAPSLAGPSGVSAAVAGDALLLVASPKRTREAAVAAFVEQARRLGVRIMGVVASSYGRMGRPEQ